MMIGLRYSILTWTSRNNCLEGKNTRCDDSDLVVSLDKLLGHQIIFQCSEMKNISRYCDKSSPGPVVSPKGTVGLEMHPHTNGEGVFSGFKGRYQFMQAKNEFGDCGGNISNSENGVIKSPNYPEKYSSNDPSKK